MGRRGLRPDADPLPVRLSRSFSRIARCREGPARLEIQRRTVEVGHLAVGLGDDQRPCRDIPRSQPEFPQGVNPPAGLNGVHCRCSCLLIVKEELKHFFPRPLTRSGDRGKNVVGRGEGFRIRDVKPRRSAAAPIGQTAFLWNCRNPSRERAIAKGALDASSYGGTIQSVVTSILRAPGFEGKASQAGTRRGNAKVACGGFGASHLIEGHLCRSWRARL
jgi:hypothetical protein